jgi:hypothetical protein
MSIQEIEDAIKRLSSSEVDELTEWLEQYRLLGAESTDILAPTKRSLADAMGDLLGSVGRDNAGEPTSSRDARVEFALSVEAAAARTNLILLDTR